MNKMRNIAFSLLLLITAALTAQEVSFEINYFSVDKNPHASWIYNSEYYSPAISMVHFIVNDINQVDSVFIYCKSNEFADSSLIAIKAKLIKQSGSYILNYEGLSTKIIELPLDFPSEDNTENIRIYNYDFSCSTIPEFV